MGLDTFASRSSDDIELSEEDLRAFEEAEISLCGGIFSGDGGDGSFRGKVYALDILEITGESLYQEWIPPETVCEMHHALANYESSMIKEGQEIDVTDIEISNLCKYFRVCCERGLGLINWW
jgi:hypothetical protein